MDWVTLKDWEVVEEREGERVELREGDVEGVREPLGVPLREGDVEGVREPLGEPRRVGVGEEQGLGRRVALWEKEMVTEWDRVGE